MIPAPEPSGVISEETGGGTMGEAIGAILGNGVGVAISPLPIVAVILTLFSPAGVRNGLALLGGWALGLTAVCSVFVLLGPVAGDDPGPVVGVLKLVVGAVFLVLAWHQWRGRPGEGEEPRLPGWMAAADQFTLGRAFVIGAALASVNPKNLGLAAAAGGSVATAELSLAAAIVVVAVFVAVGSLTVVAPVAARAVAPDRSAPVLDALRGWLTRNNSTVMIVLFLVLGSRLVGDGVTALA